MKNIFKKTSLLVMSGLGIAGLTGVITISIISSSNGGIHWANYESYMSPDLMDAMRTKYNVNFQYYSTNEDILNKFENYYDVATPATYTLVEMQERELLAPIPWEYFELNNPETGAIITNADEALVLFTPMVQAILQYDWNANGDRDDNLLEYGIPYFLQDIMFGYKGAEIPALTQANTWTDIVEIISTENPNCDPRFVKNNQGVSKMGLIDDSRTIYSIARLMETNNQQVNPQPGAQQPQMEKTYQLFADYFKTDSFLVNTDSAAILTALADPINGINAAIAFNGDILYAAQGGGLYDAYESDNFHAIHPKTDLALDMVVINKKVVGSDNENEVYDLVKDIVLDGADVSSAEVGEIDSKTQLPIYYPMMNFDYVLYTSPLNNINDYVMDTTEDGYFGVGSQADLYRKIYAIDPNGTLLLEKPLTDLQKSNMHWAYSEIKEEI